eukprot:1149008-Pelagomonas_calceolata.AAC.4
MMHACIALSSNVHDTHACMQEAELFSAWLGAIHQINAQAEKERLEAEEEEAEVGPQLPGAPAPCACCCEFSLYQVAACVRKACVQQEFWSSHALLHALRRGRRVTHVQIDDGRMTSRRALHVQVDTTKLAGKRVSCVQIDDNKMTGRCALHVQTGDRQYEASSCTFAQARVGHERKDSEAGIGVYVSAANQQEGEAGRRQESSQQGSLHFLLTPAKHSSTKA